MSLTDSVAAFDLGSTVLREQVELIFLEKRRFYQKEAHIWIPAFVHCCPGKFGNASPLVVCGALTAYSNNLPPGGGGRHGVPGGGDS